MAKDKELADHERAHSGQPGEQPDHGSWYKLYAKHRTDPNSFGPMYTKHPTKPDYYLASSKADPKRIQSLARGMRAAGYSTKVEKD